MWNVCWPLPRCLGQRRALPSLTSALSTVPGTFVAQEVHAELWGALSYAPGGQGTLPAARGAGPDEGRSIFLSIVTSALSIDCYGVAAALLGDCKLIV